MFFSTGERETLQHFILEAIIDQDTMADANIPDDFFGKNIITMDLTAAKLSPRIIQQIQRCTSLKSLILNEIFDLTDDILGSILRCCSNLEVVYLESCRKLTDKALDNLTKHCPKLRGLDIGGDYNISTDAVIRFLSNHPNRDQFTQLHLSGAAPVADRMLKLLASNCNNLVGLSIGYGKELSNAALIALLQKLPHLQSLQLHWNLNFTDEVLVALTTNCPVLQELNVTGCPGFTELELLRFVTLRGFRKEGAEVMQTVRRVHARYTQLSDAGIEQANSEGHLSKDLDLRVK
jgi:hypothetical protein